MKRRTIMLDRVRVEGYRLVAEPGGDTHLVSIRFQGRAVEIPVPPNYVETLQGLYGSEVKLALIVEEFNPSGVDWKALNKAEHVLHGSASTKESKPEERIHVLPPLGRRPRPPRNLLGEPAPKRKGGKLSVRGEPSGLRFSALSDEELLAKALEACGGVRGEMGARLGHSKSFYGNTARSIADGRALRPQTRRKLMKLCVS